MDYEQLLLIDIGLKHIPLHTCLDSREVERSLNAPMVNLPPHGQQNLVGIKGSWKKKLI
jgi:hypothetical protein